MNDTRSFFTGASFFVRFELGSWRLVGKEGGGGWGREGRMHAEDGVLLINRCFPAAVALGSLAGVPSYRKKCE